MFMARRFVCPGQSNRADEADAVQNLLQDKSFATSAQIPSGVLVLLCCTGGTGLE